MIKGKIPILAVTMVLLLGTLKAQLPLVKGHSSAPSGMLSYDVNEADDMRPRSYLYTLCPRDAGCARLDFTFLEGNGGVDFIRVFDGGDRDAPLLGTLGAKSGSMLLQASSGCLTVEFTRAESGLRSAWSAFWQGISAEDCLNPGRERVGEYIQDVCGPEYRENRSLWRNPPESSHLPAHFTYRLLVAKDGPLNFSILPDNGADEYNWELFRYPEDEDSTLVSGEPGQRLRSDSERVTLAMNFASGAGPGGTTGMTGDGRGGPLLASGRKGAPNPFCREVFLNKGSEIFLRVYAGQAKCSGFRLLLNETVMQCEQPVGALIQVAHDLALEKPKIPARDMFSRTTQVWRIDLSTKANSGLSSSPVLPRDWEELMESNPDRPSSAYMPETRGLAGALLLGLKSGLLEAKAAEDFRSPVHYGDLLDLAARIYSEEASNADSASLVRVEGDWWNPPPERLEGFQNMLELIVDEVFDKNAGSKKVQIRYVRLVWSDWEGAQPDFNVAVFRYSDLQPLLSSIRVADFRNEAKTISIRDLLEGRQFEYITTWKSGSSVHSPAEGKYLRARGQEMESYHWVK